jgi:RimJ/RimL family protein N-acetyltransferase
MGMADQESLRLKARTVLHLSDPADALYVYYALYHEAERTQLAIHTDEAGLADGFVAICQTGQRLFQPTVALRARAADVAIELLRQALTPGRPYYVITTPDLEESVTEVLNVEQSETNRIYKIELFHFKSVINVMVVTEEGLGGLPRFVIRSQDEIVAEAGMNWASPHFVEVYVHTEQAARERGWGRAVLTACTTWAIHSARQPLYVVNSENRASVALADAVGYVDTGTREFSAEGVCKAGW